MKSPTTYLLPYADISWQPDNTPYANAFEDIYWSNAGGLEEKQYIFLEGCDVQYRWRTLTPNARFTILETGFGFGLNFLLTVRAWQSEPHPQNARLEYIAYEQHLVSPHDLKKMAGLFGLEAELELMLEQYPEPVPGNHTIWIADDICLHLVVGEIHDQIETLEAEVDGIYLDGFTPSQNDAMWNEALLSKLVSCLRPGGKVSTYTVAGALRRALIKYGLTVEKAKGFGRKRDMLIAEKPGDWQPASHNIKKIIVIGAGLTGLLCAKALRRRGHKVSLVDQTSEPLGALRQIKQIAIYPQLSKTPQPYSNLYLRAYQYFLRHQALHACGRIELLDTEQKRIYGQAIAEQLPGLVDWIDSAKASMHLGISVESPALYFSAAGWITPQSVDSAETIIPGEVMGLVRDDDGWLIEIRNQTPLKADVVVLATGHQSLAQLEPLNLMPLRGQSLQLDGLNKTPNMVLSATRTWFPAENDLSTVSGTYDRFDADLQPREADTSDLLDGLLPFVSELLMDKAELQSRSRTAVGIRSATRDRMPVVDQLPNWAALKHHLTLPPISQGTFADYEPGLFCAVGFGSHGGTLGPYCAELLARQIDGEPITEDLRQISSVRFAFRDGGVKPSQRNDER
jgi:tRNA 5-methylaminomethyl-2-thiouridine biosynthesis bifunctional protein